MLATLLLDTGGISVARSNSTRVKVKILNILDILFFFIYDVVKKVNKYKSLILKL